MGWFDRFSGKNLEKSIDYYTEQYGDILVGMHELIQTHEQQIKVLRQKLDVVQDQDGQYIQMLHLLSQNKEELIQCIDLIKTNQKLSQLQHISEAVIKMKDQWRQQSQQSLLLQATLNKESETRKESIKKTEDIIRGVMRELRDRHNLLKSKQDEKNKELNHLWQSSQVELQRLQQGLDSYKQETSSTIAEWRKAYDHEINKTNENVEQITQGLKKLAEKVEQERAQLIDQLNELNRKHRLHKWIFVSLIAVIIAWEIITYIG